MAADRSRSKLVVLSEENLDDHHLCCALGDRKHEEGVGRKKRWLRKRFEEGLVFRKLDERGKVFIEYAPSEVAWRPIVAPGWMTIHCLWVSGKYAKRGYGRTLIEGCIDDARQKKKAGVVAATGKTKRPFLLDPKFLTYMGFEAIETIGDFRLYAFFIDRAGRRPRFASTVLPMALTSDAPFVMRYTDQCPLNAHWAPNMAHVIEGEGYEVRAERIRSRAKAQRVASPLGTFGLERDGGIVTHHLNTDNAVRRLLSKLGAQ